MIAAATGTCALVLVAGAGSHLAHPDRTGRQVAEHGVLPDRWGRLAVGALPFVEGVLGLALVAGLLLGPSTLTTAAATGAAVLFAGFVAYLWSALRRGSGGLPCACGLGSAPVGGWSIARAGAFAALAGLAATVPASALPDRPWPETVVVGCASMTLAIGLSALPAARRLPEPRMREVRA